MMTWSRTFTALFLAGAVLLLPACGAAVPNSANPNTGQGMGTEGGTEGSADNDSGTVNSGPALAECPQGLRDIAAKYPEETLTGDEISVSKFQSASQSKYVSVGATPSCVFESTQNNTKFSVFYVGSGKDLVATIGSKLEAEGLKAADYNTDVKQNWSNEYRSVVVSVEQYSVGDDHTWSSVDFGGDFVWVLIAFVD